MSRKTVEIEVVQCDYVNDDDERCLHEADKDRMRTCDICGIDVCENHSGMTYVTSRVLSTDMLRAGQHRYSYCFCVVHMDDLMNFVVDKLGEKYEIPPDHYGGGVGETQVLQTQNQFLLDKTSSSK